MSEQYRALQHEVAAHEHVPELADVFTAAAIRKEQLEGASLWPVPCPKEYVEGLMERSTVHIGMLSGSIAATMAVSLEDPRCWGDQPDDAIYIHRLVSHPAYKGLGLGRHMLLHANSLAIQHGREFVRLDCNADLAPYYEAQGFIQQGTFTSLRTGYVGHQYQRPAQTK